MERTTGPDPGMVRLMNPESRAAIAELSVPKLLAAGLTTLIVGQALLNIGGTLGVLPFTGVPVPLISYGGTSLVATLAAIGLVLSVGTYGGQALRDAEPVRSAPAKRKRKAATRRPQAAARPATASTARARRRRAM